MAGHAINISVTIESESASKHTQKTTKQPTNQESVLFQIHLSCIRSLRVPAISLVSLF